MTEITLNIWGREFALAVEFDCYEGENVLPAQETALSDFLEQDNLIDSIEQKVKDYCLATDPERIGSKTIENIFKYVIPKSLFVKRREDAHIVALMCDYRFNPDDGIAIVFQNEEFSRIGTQNIIL